MNAAQRRKADRSNVKRKFRVGDLVRCKTDHYNDLVESITDLSLSKRLINFTPFTVFRITSVVSGVNRYKLSKIDPSTGLLIPKTNKPFSDGYYEFHSSEIELNDHHKRRSL